MVDVVEEDTEVCRMFTLLDLDKMFEQNPDARIVNNEALVSKKLSVEFTNAIYSQSDGELGFVPTCQCGEIKGVAKEGLYCSKCHTFCTSQFIDSLSHTSWLGLPQHMPPVLHPVWYMVLRNWASVGRRNVTIIDIILNPEEDVPEDFVPYLKGRGFKYFYEHVDEMMDMLLHKYPRTAKNKAAQHIETFMKHWKSVMFTRHLPVLHNSLHPLKSSGGTLKYADSTSQEILSAIIDLSAETFAEHASHVNERQQSKTLFDIFSRVMTYYRSLIKEKLGGKTAMLRKHDFGSRIHYSFRAVVTPHDCILPMDEVILAWGIMCNGLKLPILNFLMNRHFKSVSESITIFRNALLKYDPLVDQCIQEYIQECPGGRMPVAVGRNPA